MTSKSLTLIAAAGIAATGIGAGALVGAGSASAAPPLCQASQLMPRFERSEGPQARSTTRGSSSTWAADATPRGGSVP